MRIILLCHLSCRARRAIATAGSADSQSTIYTLFRFHSRPANVRDSVIAAHLRARTRGDHIYLSLVGIKEQIYILRVSSRKASSRLANRSTQACISCTFYFCIADISSAPMLEFRSGHTLFANISLFFYYTANESRATTYVSDAKRRVMMRVHKSSCPLIVASRTSHLITLH